MMRTWKQLDPKQRESALWTIESRIRMVVGERARNAAQISPRLTRRKRERLLRAAEVEAVEGLDAEELRKLATDIAMEAHYPKLSDPVVWVGDTHEVQVSGTDPDGATWMKLALARRWEESAQCAGALGRSWTKSKPRRRAGLSRIVG